MVNVLVMAGIAGLTLVAVYAYRRSTSDRIGKIVELRRATSRMVSRGEFVKPDGLSAVVLAMSRSTFSYENAAMHESVDLQFVREIEYDTRLATGHPVSGGKVLRLHSLNETFEFVLRNDDVARWHMMLPPRVRQWQV
jgi:hypothetical protein